MANVYDLLDPAIDTTGGPNLSFSDEPADTIPNLVGVTGSVGGDAIFSYIPNGGGDTSGTGQFPSFLRIQDKPTEDGFNTDTPNGTLDDVPSVVHTHSLSQNTLATINLSGTDYYEFRLDLGQSGSSPNIVLDQLKIYTSNTVATLVDYTAATQSLGAGFTLAYDLGGSSVLLTAHNSGNGHDDYYIYIPKSDFNLSDSYITFYAQFGGVAGYNSNSSFEEFSAILNTGTPVTGQGDFLIAKDYSLNLALPYDNSGSVNHAGQVIYYQITVLNDGTDPLTLAQLTDSIPDAQAGLGGPIDDVLGDSILSVGETWHFLTSHVVTQDEMNNWGNDPTVPGYIDNWAYATFKDGVIQLDPSGAEALTPIDQTPAISIAKHTWAGTTNIDYKDVLSGTAISWTYDVTNTGNVSLANPTVTDNQGVTISPVLLGGFNTGDSNHNGVFDPNEVWHYTASGVATVGTYINTGEATDSFTGGDGTTTPLDVKSDSSYFGDNPVIKIDKVTTGKDIGGVTHIGDGINISEGTAVTWTYTVTNAGNVALSNVTVSDNVGGVSPAAVLSGGFNVGDVDHDNLLDIGESWVFTASGLAIAGSYSNIGTANGSFTDSVGQSVTVHATDPSSYVGQFHQGTPGLTIGYWYNHTTQTKADPDHHWASEAYVTGYGWGILLGDYTGTDALGSSIAHPLSAAWALAHGELFIPDAAAIQLINSSQSANDTRQTLLSQAIAAQLNINSGDRDPGYNGTAASITHNLISEAVQWLEGVSPYTTGGRIDTNGDGILSTGITNAFEYNTKTTAFTSPVLASSQPAWQLQQTYSAADYHPVGNGSAAGAGTAFSADGEGLKNALQAFNQDHLVTTPDGQYVAWDQAGTNTPSTVYTDISLNGANDFWSILHIEAHNAVNTSSLHGIL